MMAAVLSSIKTIGLDLWKVAAQRSAVQCSSAHVMARAELVSGVSR